MPNFFLNVCVLRVALPLLLIVSVIFRPCALSGIYLLFFFYLPLVPVPSPITMAGHTGIYLKVLIGICVLTAIAQIAFQIVLFAMPPYGNFLQNCENLELILRHVGFVRLDNVTAVTALTWLTPEVIMLIGSIVVFVACRKLTTIPQENLEDGNTVRQKTEPKRQVFYFSVSFGKYITLLLLCMAAVLRPSVQGGLYFLVFLSTATWWACYKSLGRRFAILLRCLLVIVVAHICVLYVYQMQWPQEELDKLTDTYTRYFGLTRLLTVDCKNTREFLWASAEWASFLNPLVLLLFYYIGATEATLLLMPQTQKRQGAFSRLDGNINGPLNRQMSRRLVRSSTTRRRWQSATRKVRLISGASPSRRYDSGRKKPVTILQDSTGSVTVAEEPDDIPLRQLEEEDEKLTWFDNVLYGLESFMHLLARNSYIGTNIMMMTWSITFHSWITFVLLLWANILWMVPNQRQAMLRCSPILVLYAWFLLISAYIYSMDLTDDELPQFIDDVDLFPIGFQKITELPCKFLFIKCLFTCMFWITMRQFMKEWRQAKQSNALAAMVAPVQVNSTPTTGAPVQHKAKTIEVIGNHAKSFLMKFWIWGVAITLFVVAITGDRMTGFRIIYMALFLVFILMFQLSFRIWRKIMFVFWITVILYSMLMLILVYTYQFKQVQSFWTNNLHISEKQQSDIGLEDYGPKQLFIRLATPTFFVIITAIQLHYFHKDFMHMSSPKSPSVTEPFSEGSSAQGGTLELSSEKTDVDTSLKFDLTEIGNMSTTELQEKIVSLMKESQNAFEVFYVFLEIHLPKIVLIIAMLVCIFDKCAIYLAFVILIVLACILGRPVQTFAIYSMSVLASLLLLVRMIYQIEYINHNDWDVVCENITFNTAEWFAFTKTDENNTLPKLVGWNIAYILAVSLLSVINIRQMNYRLAMGKPAHRLYFMFPQIKRCDADKNIRYCLKYLLNYGFYKFGVEICLIGTVILISLRMDMYAIFYGIWLCILVFLNRNILRRIWIFYFFFIVIILPIQYVMVVGLPPNLCIELPWHGSTFDRLQEWAFLLDMKRKLPVKKLICDFLLLLVVSRQAVVFRIEIRNIGREYPGGSNENVIHRIEEKGFVNPVPDFITYCRTYLDVVKRASFLSCMWITLAVMFLAGTKRVNIFSIGYLIGSFVFLWQGSDIYLRAIPNILRSWNWLLGFNVFVIFFKTILQIGGCLFVEELKTHACWFVQLMAIGCVRNFGDIEETVGTSDPKTCTVPIEFVSLTWDDACFIFLLIQRRIFNSYYFFHMVNETKATTILASRGADLIEELRHKRMMEQDETERKILEKIKAKMDRIKATQQKIHGPAYRDTTNHFVDGIFPGSRPTYRKQLPKTHPNAIRSGDYYMFDDIEDEEDIDLIEESEVYDDDDEEEESKTFKKGRTIGKIGRRGTIQTVVIVDPKDQKREKEPQPSTSKDEELSDISEPREDTTCQKILNYILFVWLFIESACLSLTVYLNTYSRDYRYILRVLNKEKKLLKEKTEYSVGLRLGRGLVWQPAGSYQTLLRESREHGSPTNLMEEYEIAEMSSVDQPAIVRLLLAMWYIILSHSDILCYCMIFLNQIKSGTFLSLALPIMVFFWGTLSIPRPSKTFWVTIIAYTEIIVLTKCVFQFKFPSENEKQSISPLYPPRIIGIEKRDDYALWDLLLLLIVFFHRFLLKCLGLWKSTYIPALALNDGDYKISKGELEAMQDGSSEIPSSMAIGSESGTIKPILGPKKILSDQIQAEELQLRKENDSIISEEQIVSIQTEVVHPCSQYATAVKLGIIRYCGAISSFFHQLTDPKSRVTANVYSWMFLCDFFNFFVILIGYSSFGPQQGDEGVSAYLEDNRVPVLFLLMLIVQFLLIIIDRAIFLRKYIFGKVIFQILQIIFLHLWLFVLYPLITDREFNSVIAPQMYYVVKCFYLLLSAYQIRCGYPTRILGNFLCKGYNYVNLFLFKGFMAVPFLFELRTVMDWMWTDTSMTVFDWMKMEDIFAHIFVIKCQRYVENEFPQPRGEKKPSYIKYLMGGACVALMIAIIWFPLVFFSLGNAVGKSNVPYDVTVSLRIGPYQPIYQMSVQSNSIFQFTDKDMDKILNAYETNKVALTFISNYQSGDVSAIKLSLDSATIWSISPPDRQRMIDEVNSTNSLSIRFQYQVSHKSNTKEDSGIIRDEVRTIMDATIDNKPNPARERLLEMLNGNESVPPIPLHHIVPKFIKVTNKGTAKPIAQLMEPFTDELDTSLRSITIKHLENNATKNQPKQEWWEIEENCTDKNYETYLWKIPYADCQSYVMYAFSDKLFPSTLNFITAGGIIGVYTTIVLVAGRLLRGLFSGVCFKIMFEDLPFVDRIYQLCTDIYLVREAGEFFLEEDLFAKLVFLFRSPETLIKWTRPKEEEANEDDEEGENPADDH